MSHSIQQSFLCDCGCERPLDSSTRQKVRKRGHNAPRQRFEIDSKTGCWNWIQYVNSKGYGVKNNATKNGTSTGAHRWMWTQKYGDIPEGYTIDHLCRNRRCVNPAHLEPVPHPVNVLRGSNTVFSVATIQSVLRHAAEGVGFTAIARSHGMSLAHVNNVVSGRLRDEVPSSYRGVVLARPIRGGRWVRPDVTPYAPGEAV